MSSSPLVSFVKSLIIDSIANEATAKFIDMIQRSSTLSLPVASEITLRAHRTKAAVAASRKRCCREFQERC